MNYSMVSFNIYHKNDILNNMYSISPNFKCILENEHKELLINTAPIDKIIEILVIIFFNKCKFGYD
jgi:hypothetical protein